MLAVKQKNDEYQCHQTKPNHEFKEGNVRNVESIASFNNSQLIPLNQSNKSFSTRSLHPNHSRQVLPVFRSDIEEEHQAFLTFRGLEVAPLTRMEYLVEY